MAPPPRGKKKWSDEPVIVAALLTVIGGVLVAGISVYGQIASANIARQPIATAPAAEAAAPSSPSSSPSVSPPVQSESSFMLHPLVTGDEPIQAAASDSATITVVPASAGPASSAASSSSLEDVSLASSVAFDVMPEPTPQPLYPSTGFCSGALQHAQLGTGVPVVFNPDARCVVKYRVTAGIVVFTKKMVGDTHWTFKEVPSDGIQLRPTGEDGLEMAQGGSGGGAFDYVLCRSAPNDNTWKCKTFDTP